MKKVITIAALVIGMIASAQWKNKTINSEFDGRFKKSICKGNDGSFLSMELDDETNTPFLALYGSYFCDDEPTIDLVLVVNGVNVLYSIPVLKSSNSHYYYFNNDIWTNEFSNDFKLASKCLIRTNQSHCTTDYYVFNMSGSTSAYNFISH
jgi:hypothetical protein